MFWEINILVPSLEELQNFRKTKDRDKIHLLCKQLQNSLEICCCIMSEVEIHVISTPLRGINSVEVSVCGLGVGGNGGGSSTHRLCRKLIVDVGSSPGAPSPTGPQQGTTTSSMQKDEESMMRMEQELNADEEERMEDELLDSELERFGGDNLTSVISTMSRPETPVTTGMGTSPPIPIPNLSPLGQLPGLPGTPTRSSSFSYFCRFSSPEAVSPLSSGYGSAPRFFQTASTQTPPLSPILLETQIKLRLLPNLSSGPDASSTPLTPEEQIRVRRERFREESRRTRFFSEGSADTESVQDDSSLQDSLPDVVAFRRSRANSAPARPVAPEIRTGRELRRIGDEFVEIFEEQRGLRRGDPHRRSLIRRILDRLAMPIPEKTTETDPPAKQHASPPLTREGSSV